ncbi:MAG: rhomboid family intramembrane serine protease [Verrucomicrobia bacterium]|nr:rhomboid family intramembrane serine protease [Verrucomicrobiota bacterium]
MQNSFDDYGWFARPRPAVKWLLAAHGGAVAFQLACLWSGNGAWQRFVLLDTVTLKQGHAWEFITCLFLHSGPASFILGILMIWLFGNQLEYEVGPKRLAQIYFLGGVGGGMAWCVFDLLAWDVFHFLKFAPLYGTWGSVNAMVMAFIALSPESHFFLILPPFTLRARHMAMIMIAISVIFLLWGDTDQFASLGGMAAGWFLGRSLGAPWRLPSIRLPNLFRPKMPSLRVVKKEPLRPSSDADFMSEKIDPILDKIAQRGIQSLTREERRLLEDAKDRLP